MLEAEEASRHRAVPPPILRSHFLVQGTSGIWADYIFSRHGGIPTLAAAHARARQEARL